MPARRRPFAKYVTLGSPSTPPKERQRQAYECARCEERERAERLERLRNPPKTVSV